MAGPPAGVTGFATVTYRRRHPLVLPPFTPDPYDSARSAPFGWSRTHKLFDLHRLDRLVLKHVAHEYFVVFDSPLGDQREDDTTEERHPVDDDAPDNDDAPEDDDHE